MAQHEPYLRRPYNSCMARCNRNTGREQKLCGNALFPLNDTTIYRMVMEETRWEAVSPGSESSTQWPSAQYFRSIIQRNYQDQWDIWFPLEMRPNLQTSTFRLKVRTRVLDPAFASEPSAYLPIGE